MDKSSYRVILRLSVRAGRAVSGPPLGPTLGQYGIPIGPFCDSFNDKTVLLKESFPLMVKLGLCWDGSYDYYIYMPRTTLFFKTLLEKGKGSVLPPEVPKYSYFLQYLVLHVSLPNEKATLVSLKINSIFKMLEKEKIDVRREYYSEFKSGSFKSVTPELLFESVALFSLRELEINGVSSSFFELRDYFLLEYYPFFLFINYLDVLAFAHNEESVGDISHDESDAEDPEDPDIRDAFQETLDLGDLEENNSLISSGYAVDLYRRFVFPYENTDQEAEIVLFPYACFFDDAVSQIEEEVPVSLLCSVGNMFSIDQGMLEACAFTGFCFSSYLVSLCSTTIENPLFSTGFSFFDISGSELRDASLVMGWVNFEEDFCTFEFSVYLSSLFTCLRSYYTDYDFRNVLRYSAAFRQIGCHTKEQGIVMTSLEDTEEQCEKSIHLRQMYYAQKNVNNICSLPLF